MLIDNTGRPYEPDELRSLYEDAFSKAYNNNPDYDMAYKRFHVRLEDPKTPVSLEISSRYPILESNSSSFVMPDTVKLIAESCARRLWWGGIVAAGNNLYSYPSTTEAGHSTFFSRIHEEISTGKWSILFLEPDDLVDFVTQFTLRDDPDGFLMGETQCYSLPEMPKGCALFLDNKSTISLSNLELSVHFPQDSDLFCIFSASFMLSQSSTGESFLLMKPDVTFQVWDEKFFRGRNNQADVNIRKSDDST